MVMKSILQSTVCRTLLLTLLLLCFGFPGPVGSQEGRSEMTVEDAERMLEQAFGRFHQARSFRFTCRVELGPPIKGDSFTQIVPFAIDSFTFNVIKPDKIYIDSNEWTLYRNQSKLWLHNKALGEYMLRDQLGSRNLLDSVLEVLPASLELNGELLAVLADNAKAEEYTELPRDDMTVSGIDETLNGAPGYRLLYEDSEDDSDLGSFWISRDTGLIGEIRSRFVLRFDSKKEKSREIVKVFSDIEIDGEIPEETFVFSPQPGDRLVKRLSDSLSSKPEALTPNVRLDKDSDELDTARIERGSRFRLGHAITGVVWHDLDDDGRREQIVATADSVLTIISPEGARSERIYLRGETASWRLCGIAKVEIDSRLHWLLRFGDEGCHVGSRPACALYDRSGEELWYFYPGLTAHHRMRFITDDINGDGSSEIILWLNVHDSAHGYYSYLIVMDARGKRLMQRRLDHWIEAVEVLEHEPQPRLLILAGWAQSHYSYAKLYSIDLKHAQD
jgi:hypothetical protein